MLWVFAFCILTLLVFNSPFVFYHVNQRRYRICFQFLKVTSFSVFLKEHQSQIDSPVVKAFTLQADGLRFNSPSGYKVGHPGHSKYGWVGQYEPSCLKFPSSVLEDKL